MKKPKEYVTLKDSKFDKFLDYAINKKRCSNGYEFFMWLSIIQDLEEIKNTKFGKFGMKLK